MMNGSRLNAKKAAIWLFNKVLTYVFFFIARRILLRLMGSRIGAEVTIHRRVSVYELKNLSIGRETTVNYGCVLDSRGGLFIGNNVNISHNVKIYTMGHDVDDPSFSTVRAAVRILDDAWIFPNVLIMPGVTVGAGAVVYPGSVVVKSVPDNSVVGGNPARSIRSRPHAASYTASFPIWFGV